MNKITDRLGRPLQDVRISVTDRCNFRCSYCMPAEIFDDHYPFLEKQELLSFDEILRLIRLFVTYGVSKIRITGGEPLLRKNVSQLIAEINKIEEIKDLALTTNGVLLAYYALELKKAGLHRVNVSLDCLSDELFGQMNGRGYKPAVVLEGIDAALDAGLEVKVNMVVKKGVNDHEVQPMATYFKEKGITLRFIEYMDVGNSNGWKLDQVVPSKEILEKISAKTPLVPVGKAHYGEVAKRYRYEGTNVEVGFITSVSEAFCSTCSRARVSADGKLYTCLFASKGHDLKEMLRYGTDEQVKNQIERVWNERVDRYSEIRLHDTIKIQREKVEMSRIGG